jgi:hypothetical protein
MTTETVLQKLARIREAKEKQAKVAATTTTTAEAMKAPTASSQLIPAATIATAQLAEEANGTEDSEPTPTLLPNPLENIVGFDSRLFLSQLDKFKTCLETKAPGIANYLKDIHSNLNQYPELCHLLTDEQLGLIVSGYFDYTDTKMAEVVVKSRKGKVSVNEAEKLFG